MAVEIRLLGALDAIRDGQPVDLGPPQQRALLALLALHSNEVVPADAVVDALWPEGPPASVTKVIQTYVSRLRKVLGEDAIERRGGGYALGPDASVDAVRFERLLAEGRPAEALALWRGPALAGVPALSREAERLEELRLRALEDRVDAELAAGRPEAVVADLRALVAEHPLRERLVARLMKALYLSGRQAEALDAYRSSRTRLVDELGIEPGLELRELERRILAQDPGLAPAASASPPAPAAAPRRRRPRRLLVAAAAALVAAGAAVAAEFALGGGSRPVAVVANSIVRIDPRTNRIVDSIRVGRDPTGIAVRGDVVWAANEGDRTLIRVDTRSRASHAIGGVAGVGFLTRDAHANVYASGWDYPFVWRIDPRTNEVGGRFRVRTRAVGVAVGGGSLWVVDRLADGVTRIDLSRPRKPGFVRVGLDPLVEAFGFGALWVANSDEATVSVIRPGLDAAQTIDVGPKPYGIAAGEGAVWVGSYVDSTITRIDPELDKVVKVISVADGPIPTGLYSVAAGAGGVWALNRDAREIVRIDPRTNRVVKRIELEAEPHEMGIDGDRVWVTVGAPGS
jgi:DNA-binding SARP family transcriptional activator/DNA-binding beta-propeller fold protein YncE